MAYQTPGEPLNVAGLGAAGYQLEFITTASTQAAIIRGADEIIVAFRGTRFEGFGDPAGFFRLEMVSWHDLMIDLNAVPVEIKPGCLVHRGLKNAFDESWPRVSARIGALVKEAPRTIWFTGHSLGGGLAILAADQCESTQGLYTFGSPKIGNENFANDFSLANAYRFVHSRDFVTLLVPGSFYAHVGKSKYIDRIGNIADTPARETWQQFFHESFVFGKKALNELLHFNPVNMDRWPVPFEALADHAPVYYANHTWNLAISG